MKKILLLMTYFILVISIIVSIVLTFNISNQIIIFIMSFIGGLLIPIKQIDKICNK